MYEQLIVSLKEQRKGLTNIINDTHWGTHIYMRTANNELLNAIDRITQAIARIERMT